MKKRSPLFLFVLLSILNILIYINRNHFEYRSYRTVSELYNADTSRWRDLRNAFSESEIAAARQELLKNITGINTLRTTDEKVRRIGHYLLSAIGHHPGGRPSDTVESLPTFAAYRYLCTQPNEPLWCGTYSRIFLLFSLAADIPSRYVEIIQSGDHHVVNECYLNESKRWMLIDLTNNILAAQASKTYLNVIEFHQAINRGNAITTLESTPLGTVSQKLNLNFPYISNYFQPAFPYHYYRTINLSQAYKPKEKLKRYLLPTSWYDIYTVESKRNVLFYIKLLFAGFWIAVTVYFFIAYIRNTL